MANKKITDFTADTTPASGDLVETVDISDNTDNASGSSKKVTATNLITKAHGLSDGYAKVATGALTTQATLTEADLTTANNTTDNVTSAKHGFAPISPADATKFLNGAATPAYAAVKDSDLAVTDVTTNNATAAQHGFLPILSGSATDFLKGDGTYGAPTSSGQSPYNAIVASSGGDYTTLSAAITAASNGWRILVKAGTYTEGGVTSALTNLTIEGAGFGQTTLTFGANSLTLSGVNTLIRDIGFSFSTGGATFSGTDCYIENVYCAKTSTGSMFQCTGDQPRVFGSRFVNTNATTGASVYTFRSTGANSFIMGNHFESGALNSSANDGNIRFSNGNQLVTNNYFKLTSTDNNLFVSITGAGVTLRNNLFDNSATGTTGAMIDNNGGQVINNRINSGTEIGIRNRGSQFVITGNYITGIPCISFSGACATGVITGNMLSIGASSTGIDFNNQGSTSIAISGNTFKSGTTGIIFGSTDNYNSVNGNVFDVNSSGPGACITDSGVANNQFNNTGIPPKFEKRFLFMENTSGGTLNAGDVVVFKAVAAGDQVTTTTTGGDNKVWGMIAETISNNSYGYIQTLGFTTVLKADGTTDIAIGDYLTPFTTAKIAQKAAAGNMVFAIALEAYTANDSSGVLDALIINPRLI